VTNIYYGMYKFLGEVIYNQPTAANMDDAKCVNDFGSQSSK
jgi:hypothetical protein